LEQTAVASDDASAPDGSTALPIQARHAIGVVIACVLALTGIFALFKVVDRTVDLHVSEEY
jgi:hypothetical protein